MDHMRISVNEHSSVILRQTKSFHKLRMLTRKCQNKLKHKEMVLYPPPPKKKQFQSIYIRKILMLSKRYESTEIDGITWLHMPLATYDLVQSGCCLQL